jgi:hypothetical protein
VLIYIFTILETFKRKLEWPCKREIGEICEVLSRMNSQEYIEILNEIMLPSVNVIFDKPVRIVFMQVELDELDTQTLLFLEKSLYLQCFGNEDF